MNDHVCLSDDLLEHAELEFGHDRVSRGLPAARSEVFVGSVIIVAQTDVFAATKAASTIPLTSVLGRRSIWSHCRRVLSPFQGIHALSTPTGQPDLAPRRWGTTYLEQLSIYGHSSSVVR